MCRHVFIEVLVSVPVVTSVGHQAGQATVIAANFQMGDKRGLVCFALDMKEIMYDTRPHICMLQTHHFSCYIVLPRQAQ